MSGSDKAFERFWALGFKRLVPIVPGVGIHKGSAVYGRRGKAPGEFREGEWGGLRGWSSLQATADDLRRWQTMGAGVGVLAGPQPDGTWLVMIDADTLNPVHAATIGDHIRTLFGNLPMRIGNAPRAAYPIRLSGPLPYASIKFDDGSENGGLIEVLSEGKQFVAAGIHPTTAKPYTWPVPLVPFADLPVHAPEKITALLLFLRQLLPASTDVAESRLRGAAPDQASLRGKIEHVRAAVAATPNTSALFPRRLDWITMGVAIKAAVEDEFEALTIFEEWSERWADGDNDPEDVVKNWRTMTAPFHIGAAYLYGRAIELSDGRFTIATLHWEEPPPATASLEPPFSTGTAVAVPSRFRFENFTDVAAQAMSEDTPFLVKGLLDLGTMSVVYGDSNSGKTFVVMDIEHCIATGRPYAGKRVRQGHVLHIFGEGARGARKRVEALRRRHGPANRFHFLFTAVNLFDPLADIEPLLAAIAALEFSFVMITIDTLARAIAGGDENSTKDMSAFVRNVDRLRAGSGAHILLVHHTGKDASRGARGSSALRAATDTEIELTPGTITVTKQRDLDKKWTADFRLDVVELGRDTDGDPITSCTVTLVQDGVATAEAAQERQIDHAVALLRAVHAEPKASQRRLVEMTGQARSKVQRGLDQLKKERLIVSLLGSWELTSKGEKALGNTTLGVAQ